MLGRLVTVMSHIFLPAAQRQVLLRCGFRRGRRRRGRLGTIVLLQRFFLLLFQVALTFLVILINSYKKIEQLNFQLFPIIFIAVVACKIEWHCNLRVIQQKFRDDDIPME